MKSRKRGANSIICCHSAGEQKVWDALRELHEGGEIKGWSKGSAEAQDVSEKAEQSRVVLTMITRMKMIMNDYEDCEEDDTDTTIIIFIIYLQINK